MASDTRERLTRVAMDRFYRDGFRNVGIDQILDDVGIGKTAFYKHFACKEDLIVATLEMQNVWLQGTFREVIRSQGGRAAVDQLRCLFDFVEQIIDATYVGRVVMGNRGMIKTARRLANRIVQSHLGASTNTQDCL
jgi:AcrR family transcriptional regulator